MLKKIIFMILLWLSYSYSQAIIPAQVKNSKNLTSDSVIVLEIDISNASSDNPDLTELGNLFDIYGVSNSSETSIINGKVTQSKKLILSLGIRDTGKLSVVTIPAIKIGNDHTESITLHITSGSSNQTANSNQANQSQLYNGNAQARSNKPTIILEAETLVKKVYVTNPFIYKIKLYFNVPINNVNLENIDIPNAQIEPYDKTKQYQEKYQGHEYMVVEQQFIVTPTTNGVLHIPPAKIRGSVANDNSPIWDPLFGSSTPFVRTSKSIDVNVLAKPNNISLKDFFPASQVKVNESWSISDNSIVDIGTPINHTVTITAHGAALDNFPLIIESQLNGFSYYEDKPTTSIKVVDNEIISTKTYKFTLIPKESGEYKFTPRAIKWLNTQTESLEVISLQSRTFKINNSTMVNNITPTSVDEKLESSLSINSLSINSRLIVIIIISFIIFIIIAYAILRLVQTRRSKSKNWDNVLYALKTNNLNLLINCIIAYVGQQTNKSMLTLDDVAKYYGSEKLAIFAKKINLAKYKNEVFSELDELVAEVDRLSKQHKKVKKSILKEFYPQ